MSDQHTNAILLYIFLISDSKQNARKKVDLTRLKLVVSVRRWELTVLETPSTWRKNHVGTLLEVNNRHLCAFKCNFGQTTTGT